MGKQIIAYPQGRRRYPGYLAAGFVICVKGHACGTHHQQEHGQKAQDIGSGAAVTEHGRSILPPFQRSLQLCRDFLAFDGFQ